jgi:hypothetical protein
MLKSGSKREKKPNPHPASVAAREAPADLVSEAALVSVDLAVADLLDPVDLAAGEVVAAAHQASVDSEDLGSVAPAAQVVAAQVDLVVRESPASPVSASQPPMCKASKTKTSTIAV